MSEPKRNIYGAVEDEVRVIVGSTDFILRQVGKQLFNLQIPPGVCWRCPNHPMVEIEGQVHEIVPQLKQAFGIA